MGVNYILYQEGGGSLKFINNLKNYDEDDLMSKILFLYFSFVHGAIGIFFMFEDTSKYNSKVLKAMDSMLPMKIWGVIMLVSTLCFVLSVLQEGKPKYAYMIIAGVSGSAVFGLLMMANLELASQQTNTINYAIVSSIDTIIALVGGVALWRLRT